MALDKRYLEWHGNQWRVQMKVPEKVRSVVGKAKLVKPLHTASLAVANKDRWPVIAEFKRIVSEAEGAARQKNGRPADPLLEEAMAYREDHIRAVEDPDAHGDYDANGELVADGVKAIEGFISDRAIEISEAEGPARASLFYGIAAGKTTPLTMLLETWLNEKQIKPRQKLDYRRGVLRFDTYLSTHRKTHGVQEISRRLAGEYVRLRLSQHTHPKTLNKDVSVLSSYWRWLINRGHAEVNVWLGQTVEHRRLPKGEDKRPFTEDEMRSLLAADVPGFLKDAMLVAALSGMRAEEIGRLKVGDVQNGLFHIHVAKTKAGERVVPIHSTLEVLIKSRCIGKTPNEYIFHELPTPAVGSPVERSQKISKRFTVLRRKMGLDDRVEGHRQARATFHSFRRWFITEAEKAGILPHIISAVVGHARQGMTLGTYSAGPSIQQMRECVEAVRV